MTLQIPSHAPTPWAVRTNVVKTFAIMTMAICLIAAFAAQQAAAQTTPLAASAPTVVPTLIPYSSTALGTDDMPLSGEKTITFQLFKDEQGGESIWAESQLIAIGSNGRYRVQLGASLPSGLPPSTFASGEGRWLEVQIAGQQPQPRVLLMSVPYAMKAADAATLGGLPASAFALAGSSNASAQNSASPEIVPSSTVTATGGTAGYLPVFSAASTIDDSLVFESGKNIGIGTKTPATTLDVAGATTLSGPVSVPTAAIGTSLSGAFSYPFSLTGSVFNPLTKTASNQTFEWQVIPILNDTSAARGLLSLNYQAGSGTPKNILGIDANGEITFSPSQVFPGLAGLPISNTFTASQTIKGDSNALNATATSANGVAVLASGGAYGIFANATGASGVGLFGSGNWGVQGAGKAYGVYGQASASNSTGVYGTGGQFGLYGVTNQGPGTAGVFAIGSVGVQGSGTIYGVEGASKTPGAIGVFGNAPAYGVYGTASAAGSYGVYGSGQQYGVYGNGGKFGLYGVTNQSEGTAGVFAIGSTGVQAGGTNYGVTGSSTTAGGTGVYGSAPKFGMYGVATGGDFTVGVFGSGGYGMQAGGTQYGMYSGVTSSSAIAGTYGLYGSTPSRFRQRIQNGVITVGYNYSSDEPFDELNLKTTAGIWADTNFQSIPPSASNNYNGLYAPALFATADDTVGTATFNDSIFAPALLAVNFGTGTGIGSAVGQRDIDVIRAVGPAGTCSLSGAGDTSCTGTLKSVVKATANGGVHNVETYAVQAAENWFEDAGSGRLANGATSVSLEAVFGQTVNTSIEYHIFLTPKGDCKGLYVSNETASSFEVHELGGGASSVAFDYRIMAKRVGHEQERLVDVTERMRKQAKQRFKQ